MVDPITFRRFCFRVGYLFLAALILFLLLLPLGSVSSGLPSPDWLFVFTAAWMMRRPRFVPVGLIAFVFVLADCLYLYPIGLWSALMILAFEYLRSQSQTPGEISLFAELLHVSFAFSAATLAYGALTGLFSISNAGLVGGLQYIALTLVAYPFAVLATHFVFKVRRARPQDIDQDKALA